MTYCTYFIVLVSLLIFKLMFKGVSVHIPSVDILYFRLFSPFHCSPLPLYLWTPFSTALNTHTYILYLHGCYVLWYYWCSINLCSFPSFPEFHGVVLLWQICSTSEFVYDHDFLCVYVYLLDLSSMYERKYVAFVFLYWLTSLNMMSSNCIHLLSNHMSLLLLAK
jgi:hypothetical protein